MPILLSASSLAARRHRKALQHPSSAFSWTIFFIAIATFTVWSLGVSTCLSPSDQSAIVHYYQAEAHNTKHFATVLLLLQQLSDQLHHILPAIVTALLLSHIPSDVDLSHLDSSAPSVLSGGLHKAELAKEKSTAELLRLFQQIGNNRSATKGKPQTSD